MQKIIPHLWYDKEAAEAAGWYVGMFKNSVIINVSEIQNTPSGNVDLVDFQLANLKLSAISAGPYYSINQSVSFLVACDTIEEVDRLYACLSPGGTELMPLGEYLFSKRYVWTQDKYGLG